MSEQTTDAYVGRFAPSPTGPLHFGSLVAALASYLDARHQHGRWLVRIEDLDPPRESTEAPAQILHQLAAFGFEIDGDVLYQSTRLDAYQEALEELTAAGLTFPCDCSRKSYDGVYPGRCRTRTPTGEVAIRVRVEDEQVVGMNDRILGQHQWQLGEDVGDFIVRRKDGLFAYQLAVVVDDGFQDITHIVRGNDLLDSTPRQLYLTDALGYRPVSYAHIPLILGPDGSKLSKQAHAAAIDTADPMPILRRALAALGQPSHPGESSPSRLLQLASRDWDVELVPRREGLGPGDY